MSNNGNLDLLFIYPADYFNKNKVDEIYQQEYEIFKSKALKTALVNIDKCSEFSFTATKEKRKAIYRGWMLSEQEYRNLYEYLLKFKIELVSNPNTYIKSHYLPNWYSSISSDTPETVICNDIEDTRDKINKSCWDKYFIKDYVKSVKVDGGSSITCANYLDTVLS